MVSKRIEIEVRRNSFDCIIDGSRCTKCCEAIHVGKDTLKFYKNKNMADSDQSILKYWRLISKRVAKKINPYMFSDTWPKEKRKWVNQEVIFFKCLAFVDGKCSIYNDRPYACKDFIGRGMYQYECAIEDYDLWELKNKERKTNANIK